MNDAKCGLLTLALALGACDASAPSTSSAPALAPALATAALSASDRSIPYSGYVDFDGTPVNANSVHFNFTLYPCASTSSCQSLWTQVVTLPIFAGRFTVELGGANQSPLPDVIFEDGHEVLYLAIQIEGKALGNLQKIVPATHAISANEADHLRVRASVDFDDGASITGSPLFDGDLDVSGTLNVAGEIGAKGRSPLNLGTSCGQILATAPGSTDGIYWISPDGGPAFQVACDMTKGGLTYATFERGAKKPVVWWDMETTNADGSIKDLVGTNDLVIHGGPQAGQPGRQGLAYNIQSTEDFFVSKSAFDAKLVGNSAKSISVWVNVPNYAGTASQGPVVSFGYAPERGAFAITLVEGPDFYFVGYNTDTNSGSGLSVNAWHHLVATYDLRNLRLYFDGAMVVQVQRNFSTTNTYDRYVVGADSWWTTATHRFGRGLIDEPKIYTYALTARDVMELYNLGLRGTE